MGRVYYGQAGYEGCSRSTRAAEAEENGRLPLTRAIPVVAARAGVTRKVARAALVATHDGEWHHTGNRARRTNYYSLDAAVRHLDPEFAAECEEAERTSRIETFRARLIRRRDCSVFVARRVTAHHWQRLGERLAKPLGLLNCYGGVFGGDVDAKPGDFIALHAELDARLTKKAEDQARAAELAERNRREVDARRARARAEREAAVFVNLVHYWPHVTDEATRRQYAAKYAELRETMNSSRAYDLAAQS